MTATKWWDSKQDGAAVNVVILQFDLGSHTQTARDMDTDTQAFQEFKTFGVRLEEALRPFGYHCLHWLGDGGLYAKQYDDLASADDICTAADCAFEIFDSMWKAAGHRLSLRATATLLDRVYFKTRATGTAWISTTSLSMSVGSADPDL